MNPILLTVMADGSGTLSHGDTLKQFGEPDDPLEFMAWLTQNGCTASPLFSILVHYRGGRVWVITPEDDDAGFLLRMRWL